MVQVIENWSGITGTVCSLKPDAELPDHVVAEVDVDSVVPVARETGEPYANLLGDTAGARLNLTLPAAVAASAGVEPGRRIAQRAQRSSPFRCFLDPQHLSVE